MLSACSSQPSSPAGKQPGQAIPQVGIVTMQPEKVIYTTQLAGRTTPFQIAEVRPQVSGIIQARLFTEGSDVKAGDTLYQIDPASYQAQVDSMRATLNKAEANVAPAKLKMQRFKDLVNISAVSKQEYEDAEAAYKQALADVGMSEAALETARIRLNYTKVKAPISGRIGRSTVTAGALVTENQATSLSTIQQLDPIYVDMTQSTSEVMRLQKSLAAGRLQRTDSAHALARLVLEDGTIYAEPGSLQFSDVSVDQGTGAITLRAIFPNPRQELLPGMYVRAILQEGVDEAALLLPQKALLRDPRGNPLVMIVNAENKVESRKLSIGRTHESFWIVQDGLKAGDRVILDGLQKIRPGVEVTTVAVTGFDTKATELSKAEAKTKATPEANNTAPEATNATNAAKATNTEAGK